MNESLWPVGVYFILGVILTGTMLLISYFLGQRHQNRATGPPFESGIVSEGSARARFPTKFYLVAMFFVVFDLEAVFSDLPEAVGKRQPSTFSLPLLGGYTLVVLAILLV